MHNGFRNQQRSDSAPIDVWHKILFTSVGAIFLKIYNLIPNVTMDSPTTCTGWSEGSVEILKHECKNFVLLAGLQKKTEINAKFNMRDTDKKHVPLLALQWLGSQTHQTPIQCPVPQIQWFGTYIFDYHHLSQESLTFF